MFQAPVTSPNAVRIPDRFDVPECAFTHHLPPALRPAHSWPEVRVKRFKQGRADAAAGRPWRAAYADWDCFGQCAYEDGRLAAICAGERLSLGGPGRPPFQPSDDQRALVRRRVGEDSTTAGIAREIGLSVPTLRKYFARELTRLQSGAAA